ncbi:MAG: DUF58 domain-containing protein [Oscillospiraceae bacterium]|nr:DUF58 domain-containing protein [Oscillospiraceae bacterium]
MVKNRIFYTLAILACLGFSMAYTSKVSAVLLITVAAYPVVGTICTLIQAFLFRAEFNEKRVVSEKDTLFEMFLNVKNSSIFPCVPAEIQCTLPDSDSGLFVEKRIFTTLPPLGSARLSVNCRHIYRGSYSCRIRKICVYDPLRIIRISRKKNIEISVVFLPRRLELEDVLKPTHGDQSYTQNIITAERDDFSHVRDYRDGDLYQMVHWKLTAKTDDIMIKQYDSLTEQRAAILCGWRGDGDILMRTDTVIETSIAFVSALLKKNVGSYVDYEGENICKVSDLGEFERFYELMSVIPVNTNPEDFVSRIDNTDLCGLSALVLITPELSDDIVARANAASASCKVYLVYINLLCRNIPPTITEEKFSFLDIRAPGQDALDYATQLL